MFYLKSMFKVFIGIIVKGFKCKHISQNFTKSHYKSGNILSCYFSSLVINGNWGWNEIFSVIHKTFQIVEQRILYFHEIVAPVSNIKPSEWLSVISNARIFCETFQCNEMKINKKIKNRKEFK